MAATARTNGTRRPAILSRLATAVDIITHARRAAAVPLRCGHRPILSAAPAAIVADTGCGIPCAGVYGADVPSSLVVMVPSPSLSNREKASLNSAICSGTRTDDAARHRRVQRAAADRSQRCRVRGRALLLQPAERLKGLPAPRSTGLHKSGSIAE
jgi:hypothetical protein